MPSFEQGRENIDVPGSPQAARVSTDDASPVTPQNPRPVEPPATGTATEGLSEDVRARMDKVLQSDIGINTLLTRLKQSISSAKDFSIFLKDRAKLEESHAQGLKRLARGSHEVIRRSDNRQGSYAQNYEEVIGIQERMAENGMEFSHEILLMSDQLRELAADTESGRKHWKKAGQDAEQRAQDAVMAMRKAKDKYWLLADQYDRARTGEKQSGKFGLKTKTGAQAEENLLGKADSADDEYAARVQAAQAQRHELLTSSRPQAIQQIQALILQCDAGLSSQLAKFAAISEKMLLSNGLALSPLASAPGAPPSARRSAREYISSISNQRDFEEFVLSYSGSVSPAPTDIKYEKHPALVPAAPRASYGPTNPAPGAQAPFMSATQAERRDTGSGTFGGPNDPYSKGQNQVSGVTSSSQPPYGLNTGSLAGGPINSGSYNSQPGPLTSAPTYPSQYATAGRQSLDANQPPPPQGQDYRNFSGPPQHRPNQPSYSSPPTHQRYGSAVGGQFGNESGPAAGRLPGSQPPYAGDSQSRQGPGGYSAHQPTSALQQQPQQPQQPQQHYPGEYGRDPRGPPQGPEYQYQQQQNGRGLPSQNGNYRPQGNQAPNSYAMSKAPGPAMPRAASLPPLRPVFGVTLDDLFRRDQAAVPAIVYQCVQAVDSFGLDVEGIYRTSGSAQHIQELRAQFDHDSSQVDLSDRSSFFNDIAAVTTLLKHFLRDLKDPLLTAAKYSEFIQAARVEDDIQRRDSLHALINSLPDPNYATLRTLTLHLYRVSQHSAQNRMSTSNLAIVFGPTLMGTQNQGPTGDIKDAGWQARVVETILHNTFQIFDDDE